jgi:hypothetical protein
VPVSRGRLLARMVFERDYFRVSARLGSGWRGKGGESRCARLNGGSTVW